ncbi:MAG: hypothetical protein R3Y05_03415 [bacterium]
MILLVVLFYFTYKIFTYKKVNLIRRDIVPKICLFINSDYEQDILELLVYQNYPKHLFDVYIKSNNEYLYNFNISKYNSKEILNSDYDIVCIVTKPIDINYLNFTVKEYLKGYDVIISNSCNINNLLAKRNLNKFFNNMIFDSNFSFSHNLYKENIINLGSPYLRNFLSHKTNLITYSPLIETFEEHNEISINTLDKGFIYFKLYLLISIIFVFLVTNNIFNLLIFFYIITIIDNFIFLNKHNKLNYLALLLLPITTFSYLLKFFVNNIRSNINTIQAR